MADEIEHTVGQGDCISSIAAEYGFFWQTVWDHNAELKERRKDPNALLEGDVVKVPEFNEKEVSRAPESRHRFRKKGVPAMLRLIMERNDLPLANLPYTLTVDERQVEGTTDNRGYLEQPIPPDAQHAVLEIDGDRYELELGGMDPIEEPTGIQCRLQNLGFYHGPIDGEMGSETKAALAEFQAFSNLTASGELDSETRDALFARQDEHHPTAAENGPPEEAEESTNEEAESFPNDEDDEELEETPECEPAQFDETDDGRGGL